MSAPILSGEMAERPPPPPGPSLEDLLDRVTRGDRAAADELLPRVYDELKRIATAFLAHERAGHTLQPTALVHEAYLKLIGREKAWHGRVHFEAAAAAAMRRILVDHARKRGAEKRGNPQGRVELESDEAREVVADTGRGTLEVLELDQLLAELAELDPRKARVVELRFFAGMTNEQIAEALDVARSTVADDWAVSRAWLASRIHAKER